jgi:hypothetical protein
MKLKKALAVMALLPLFAHAQDYKLVEDFSGKDFFNHFEFETIDDPTHGAVDYVRESRARYLGLLSYNETTGQIRIAADSKNKAHGRGRPSVRLKSKTVFNKGLFIIDVNHIPEGNATWPAFWSFGPNWPYSGEIDIIEGRNDQSNNQATLHTGPGCVMPTPDASKMTGRFIESLDCNYKSGLKGCTTLGDVDTFGPGLNKKGGGVFALLWTNTNISVWHWSRENIPQNIVSGAAPDPAQWGLPVSYFQLGNNCLPRHFQDHRLVLNTTFCGDWAGPEFVGPTGRGVDACRRYVKGYPKEFAKAYWDINYIRAYQK